MAHEWHKGILDKSSWHGLEEVGVIPDAETMIARADTLGAWPITLDLEAISLLSGKPHKVPGSAVIGGYEDGSAIVYGVVGDRYTPTEPEQWRALVRAACDAGARPTGAFSLRGGSRVLATFEIPEADGRETPLKTYLLMVDDFTGDLPFTCGDTTICVVCLNTLQSSMRADRGGMARVRHTASLGERLAQLETAIGETLTHGQAIRETYSAARERTLNQEEMWAIVGALFPVPEKDGAGKTRAQNKRREMAHAMANPVNQAGPTLATVWNGATWLVDRTATGQARPTRGSGDSLDSLLLGTRGKRIAEIQRMVEVVLRDGTIAEIPMSDFAHHKADEGDDGGLSGLLTRPAQI